MLYFVELLRAIATAFILNSHCEGVYPIELAIGGKLGLAIFFLLTGYLSTNITQETLFIRWFPKRALRIYISVWIFDLVLLLCGRLEISSFADAVRIFVLLSNYWFASFIIFAYVVYFILKKYIFAVHSLKLILVSVMALIVSYFAVYCFMDNSIPHNSTTVWQTRILWMACILVGTLVKESHIIEKTGPQGVYLLFFSVFLLLYGIEKILYLYKILLPLQFLCLLLPIVAALFLFIFMGKMEEKLRVFDRHPFLFRMVECFSKASFEIYRASCHHIAV